MEEKIGILLDQDGKLITLTREQLGKRDFLAEFAVFLNGAYDRSITRVTFLETEPDSGKFDYFGLLQEAINKVSLVYDGLKIGESVVLRILGVDGYLDTNPEISRVAFESKNLKIILRSLKDLTQEEKINIIKSDFDDISRNYISRFTEEVSLAV
jgi:hypothetical protein